MTEIDFLFASDSVFAWNAEKEFTRLSALAHTNGKFDMAPVLSLELDSEKEKLNLGELVEGGLVSQNS